MSAVESLRPARERALGQLKRLPESLKGLERGPEYPVTVSGALVRLAEEVDAMHLRSAREIAAAGDFARNAR